MSNPYDIAKAGGKHAGLVNRFDKEPVYLVEKSLRSVEKRIAEHELKVAKPMDFVDNSITDTPCRNFPTFSKLAPNPLILFTSLNYWTIQYSTS